MGTKIVYDSNTEVVSPNVHPADLAKQIESRSGANWSGGYLYLPTTDGRFVWINSTTIAYLEETAD